MRNAYVTGLTTVVIPGSEPPVFTADAFVAKIYSNGTGLGFFFRLGGSDDDWGNGIAVDGGGNIYITGETWSVDFPTIYPFQWALYGSADGFVTKIKPAKPCITGPILELLLQ